jgi:hypothetical protein
MPTVAANGITIHYDVAGSGEPLVLIPFFGPDNSGAHDDRATLEFLRRQR